MIHIFNINFIFIHYVCQVISNCKKVSFQKKVPFYFSLLVLFTCEITILFLKILGIFTNVFSTLFITSCYMIYLTSASLNQWHAVTVTFNCESLFTINNQIISLTGSFMYALLIWVLPKCLNIPLLTFPYVFSIYHVMQIFNQIQVSKIEAQFSVNMLLKS